MDAQNICWMQQGNNYKIVPSSIQINNTLNKGIYSVQYSDKEGFSLNLIAKSFEFDFEVLGIERKFIDHVITSYNHTSGNFGVLMNGVKGCGKTVTAKILANSFDLPVILVDAPYPRIENFLSSLNFSCVLFFDEYEKNFKANSEDDSEDNKSASILTIMDGVFNCTARKVFLMTTNELKVNKCLLSRPSRIRYVKEFTNISLEVINSLLDKFLNDQSIREEIILYVTSLDVVSVDIIKAIIQEVNIHGKDSFAYIKEIFNVQISPVHYAYYYCLRVSKVEPGTVTFSRAQAAQVLKRYKTLKEKPLRDAREEKEFSGYYENENQTDEVYHSGLEDYCWDIYNEFPAKFENLNVGDIIPGRGTIEEIDKEERMIGLRCNNTLWWLYVPEQRIYNRNTLAYGYGK